MKVIFNRRSVAAIMACLRGIVAVYSPTLGVETYEFMKMRYYNANAMSVQLSGVSPFDLKEMLLLSVLSYLGVGLILLGVSLNRFLQERREQS